MFSSLCLGEHDTINFSKSGVLWPEYFNGETVEKGDCLQFNRLGHLKKHQVKSCDFTSPMQIIFNKLS